jgi:hypothetical protein
VIYCIGEKLEEREAGNTMSVNARQLKVGQGCAWVDVRGGDAGAAAMELVLVVLVVLACWAQQACVAAVGIHGRQPVV